MWVDPNLGMKCNSKNNNYMVPCINVCFKSLSQLITSNRTPFLWVLQRNPTPFKPQGSPVKLWFLPNPLIKYRLYMYICSPNLNILIITRLHLLLLRAAPTTIWCTSHLRLLKFSKKLWRYSFQYKVGW